jgi:hypothetical protein
VPENVHVERGESGVVVNIGVLKQTRVEVALRRPTLVQLPGGPEEIVVLRLYVDDAAAFVAAARETKSPSPPSPAEKGLPRGVGPSAPERSHWRGVQGAT